MLSQTRVGISGTLYLQTGAELSGWEEQVDVVAADKVLRERDDGGGERSLAVMVGAVLADVTAKLRHLDVRLQVALERTEQTL